MSGTLYIISTPIGNPGDITLRALRVLGQVDAVICEEYRVGSTLLAHYRIEKPLVELNEHTHPDQVRAMVERLQAGESLGLISDHGTPLVSDPGASLVEQTNGAGIRIEPLPGASSPIAALVASGLPAYRFRYVGTLPAKTEQRRRALAELSDVTDTLVLIDAPYRLLALLGALQERMGRERQAAVACDLTTPEERIVRGSLGEIVREFTRRPFKGEFVVAVEGARGAARHQRR